MKSNIFKMMRMLGTALAFAVVFAGCASAPKETAPKAPPVALGLSVEEALAKYAGVQQQVWGDRKVSVYFFDPARFSDVKAEIDAGGEYTETDMWQETRDWMKGEKFARIGIFSGGIVELCLGNADNSTTQYGYKKVATKGKTPDMMPKLQASVGKYIVPQVQTWDAGEKVTVYALDPAFFEDFRVEVDADKTYLLTRKNTYDRDWDKGIVFAQWCVRANGSFNLRMGNKDNSTIEYRYAHGTPKTIVLTGAMPKGVTKMWDDIGLFPEAGGFNQNGEWSMGEVNGDVRTYKVAIPDAAKGKFFLMINTKPPKDPAKDGADYVYSADGVNPTAVDLIDDVTTLELQKFIWLKDYTAG